MNFKLCRQVFGPNKGSPNCLSNILSESIFKSTATNTQWAMWLRKDQAEVATLQRVENIIPVNSFIVWCYTMGVRALLQGMRGQPLRTRFLAVAWIVGITRHDFKPEQVTLPWFPDFNWPYTVRSLVWIALIHLDIINPQVTQPNEISNLLPQCMIFTARKEGRDKRRLESFRRFLTFHGRDSVQLHSQGNPILHVITLPLTPQFKDLLIS